MDSPALELAPPEIKLFWDPDSQQVRVHFDPHQFKNIEMLLLVLEAARLNLTATRDSILGQQRLAALIGQQQASQLRQNLRLN